jgi:hypothetical protein
MIRKQGNDLWSDWKRRASRRCEAIPQAVRSRVSQYAVRRRYEWLDSPNGSGELDARCAVDLSAGKTAMVARGWYLQATRKFHLDLRNYELWQGVCRPKCQIAQTGMRDGSRATAASYNDWRAVYAGENSPPTADRHIGDVGG